MSAKPVAADVAEWASELEAAAALLAPHFARSEPRERATAYLRGLLSDVERKNGWQLAERAGGARPYGAQHLPGRADWSADGARDELVRYAHRVLADPRGVLVVDETGFLKKGSTSAGAARQYSGTAGRIEKCQVGVFLASAGSKGRALLGRALYLPKEWAADTDRRDEAGVPEEVAFATKPRLAEAMVGRALRLGVRAAWVTGDAVYGNDGAFRRFLEQAGQPYVLAVQAGQRLWAGFEQRRVDALAAEFAAGAWHRASTGGGSKGPRVYDWAVAAPGPVDERGWQLRLLVRRHRERADELAYDPCRGPGDTPWGELVRAAGARWRGALKSPRARAGWTSTRCGRGPGGTGT